MSFAVGHGSASLCPGQGLLVHGARRNTGRRGVHLNNTRRPVGPAQVLRAAVEVVESKTETSYVNPDAYTKIDVGLRRASIPYKDEPRDCEVLVNDQAKEAIRANGVERFVHLIDPTSPKLRKLLKTMEAGWDKIGVKNKNSGHHSLWPEAFEAGKALLEEAFPEECDPAFGGEVLSGVAFVGDEDKDKAIDFMQRRPKGDFTMCKYNPLNRLHRDPDAIDYKSPGWMESAMPESDEYSYRYYNIWMARSPIDPTGQVWESPLCLLLPKDSGAQEWDYDVRLPEDNDEDEERGFGDKMAKVMKNPMSAAPMVMQAFSFKKKVDKFEATDPDYFERGSPELQPDDSHVWVTGPYLIFDSFDMWHGAGTWERDFKSQLRNSAKDQVTAKRDSIKGRVSMELRFRARCKPRAPKTNGESDAGVPFSPLSSAYRSRVFTNKSVRPTGGQYDLQAGKAK